MRRYQLTVTSFRERVVTGTRPRRVLLVYTLWLHSHEYRPSSQYSKQPLAINLAPNPPRAEMLRDASIEREKCSTRER